MKPYYEDSNSGITIYHGDARDLPVEDVVQAIVTSPPYNVGINYDEHDDGLAWGVYWKFVVDCAAEMERVLALGGRTWVNVAPVVQEVPGGAGRNGRGGPGRAVKQRQSLAARWAVALEDAGLQPADIVAWQSMRGSGTAWGSYQMPSAPNIRGDWEAVLVHFKDVWLREVPNGFAGWRDTIGNWPALVSNVWSIRPARRSEHPAPFPEELAARAIRLSTWPDERVLDPFMGEGNTLVAAKNLGRKAIGIELSEHYCEIAAKRLAQEVLDFA